MKKTYIAIFDPENRDIGSIYRHLFLKIQLDINKLAWPVPGSYCSTSKRRIQHRQRRLQTGLTGLTGSVIHAGFTRTLNRDSER